MTFKNFYLNSQLSFFLFFPQVMLFIAQSAGLKGETLLVLGKTKNVEEIMCVPLPAQ